MQKYLIGVDGGGTKLEILLANEDGDTLFSHSLSTMRLMNILEDKSWSELVCEELFKKIVDWEVSVNDCGAICLGLRDLNTLDQAISIRDGVSKYFPKTKIAVTDDSEIAYYAATGGNAGVVVVSGTGSVAFGSDAKGNFLKLGGHGPIIGDEGSGFYIGKNAVTSAILAAEDRGIETVLSERIPKRLSLRNMIEVRDYLNDPPFVPGKIADLVSVVKKTAMSGDEVSIRILYEAGEKLGELALAVCRGLDLYEPDVFAIGKVLMLTQQVYESFYNKVLFGIPSARIALSRNVPVKGAIIVAQRLNSSKNTYYMLGRAWEYGKLPEKGKLHDIGN